MKVEGCGLRIEGVGKERTLLEFGNAALDKLPHLQLPVPLARLDNTYLVLLLIEL